MDTSNRLSSVCSLDTKIVTFFTRRLVPKVNSSKSEVGTALSFSKPQGDRGDPIKDEVNQDPTNHQRTLRTDEQTL